MKKLRSPIRPEQKGDGVKATKTNQRGQLLESRELHKGQCCVDFQEMAGVGGGEKRQRMQVTVEGVLGLKDGWGWFRTNFWISSLENECLVDRLRSQLGIKRETPVRMARAKRLLVVLIHIYIKTSGKRTVLNLGLDQFTHCIAI
jgi:hypothetical protein